MLNKLRSFVKQYGLILPGDRVTVALSGGKDSVILAKLMQELQRCICSRTSGLFL